MHCGGYGIDIVWTGLVDPLNQWIQLITLLIILVSVLAEGAGISCERTTGQDAH